MARAVSSESGVRLIDQPTTFREYRSKTMQRYTHPRAMRMYVMSETYILFGPAAAKWR